jgi:hypothetical protein
MQVDNMISEKMKYKFLAEGFDSGDRIGRSGEFIFRRSLTSSRRKQLFPRETALS